MSKTYLIVGGVAGGASAAARLRRLDDSAHIIIAERSGYVSFANCGLPYHLSDKISDRAELLLNTPESLAARLGLDVRVRTEVTQIRPDEQVAVLRDLGTGLETEVSYDDLVLSPGASPRVPPIRGAEFGLVLRSVEDLDAVKERLSEAENVVIVGGGFVGVEVAENVQAVGKSVTVIEAAPQILTALDAEMVQPIRERMQQVGVDVRTNTSVTEVTATSVSLVDGETLPADLLLFSIGVTPEVNLARAAGLRIGVAGGIWVNDRLHTSAPHIWAVGDAIEKSDDNGPRIVPLANTANREGRRVADHIHGLTTQRPVALGTAIVGAFGWTAAVTGKNERQLTDAGQAYSVVHIHPAHHVGYYPGANSLALKLLFAPDSGRVLGAQAVGTDGVDKRIDVLATVIRFGGTVYDLIDLELAYAPQFGAAKDPINLLGYVAENRLTAPESAVSVPEALDLYRQGWTILDVRTAAEIVADPVPVETMHIPIDQLRAAETDLPTGPTLVLCAAGQRAHTANRVLAARGTESKLIDGGANTLLQYLAAERLPTKPMAVS